MTCHAADCSGSNNKKKENKTSATALGFALATRGIKCHIKNNARIRVTNYVYELARLLLQIAATYRISGYLYHDTHIHMFPIDITIDLNI